MTEKPDNGDILAQQAVPILPDDTAHEVFQKVTVAAEMALNNVLPALLAGKAQAVKQDLSKGAYFGGRKAEDGIIDWSQSALEIHNLVRAVAPPYPGATTTAGRYAHSALTPDAVDEKPAFVKEAFMRSAGKRRAACGALRAGWGGNERGGVRGEVRHGKI
jgi:methionyl-tRNA formyltransferase